MVATTETEYRPGICPKSYPHAYDGNYKSTIPELYTEVTKQYCCKSQPELSDAGKDRGMEEPLKDYCPGNNFVQCPGGGSCIDSLFINVNTQPTKEVNKAVNDYREKAGDSSDAIATYLEAAMDPYTDVHGLISRNEYGDFMQQVKDSDDGLTHAQQTLNAKIQQKNAELNTKLNDLKETVDHEKQSVILKHRNSIAEAINRFNDDGIDSNVREKINEISELDDGNTKPSHVMGAITDVYSAKLKEQRDKQQKMMNQINTYDGELSDSKLGMASYRLHTVVFGIIFVVIVGITIRAMTTSQSNLIETIIVFIAVALAVYYLIDYYF
tara:strand:- start:4476 stop:5453 length:978 start_codon:yes stop_codon:yes gene_type:complete